MSGRKGSTRGFTRTSTLLEKRIRKVSESRGFSESRVLTRWVEIVGQDIASVARPVDVSYGRQGLGATLTVLTTGAQAPMIEMQKEKLREKVNAVYGYNAISRIRITQTAPVGFAEGKASFEYRKKQDGPTKPDPATTKKASDLAAPVGDAALRSALENLGQNILSNRKE